MVAGILEIDGRPRLNLASFVTTWMEPEADRLMQTALNKNAIDLVEYPAVAHIQVSQPRRLQGSEAAEIQPLQLQAPMPLG